MEMRDGNQITHAAALVTVVDDDESVREALLSLLKSVGFRVLGFATAEEFLNEVEDNMPDCLILDVRMPGISGLELQQILIKKTGGCSIVFISAHSEENAQAKAMAAGAIGFILKPFSEDSLLEAVNLAISSSGGTK
jgi:FixJ family two-component response regulator